jgi:hypothetical protein
MRPYWPKIARVVLVLSAPMTVSSCNLGQSRTCAGQYGPPTRRRLSARYLGFASEGGPLEVRELPVVLRLGVPYRSSADLLHASVSTKVFGTSRARLLLRCLTRSPPFCSPPGLTDFAGVETGCQVPSARGRRAGSVRSA